MIFLVAKRSFGVLVTLPGSNRIWRFENRKGCLARTEFRALFGTYGFPATHGVLKDRIKVLTVCTDGGMHTVWLSTVVELYDSTNESIGTSFQPSLFESRWKRSPPTKKTKIFGPKNVDMYEAFVGLINRQVDVFRRKMWTCMRRFWV